MSTAASVITFSPPSAAFMNARTTALGPWVLGSFLDCIILGVIFCQTMTFFRTRKRTRTTLQQYYCGIVILVVFLSVLKTAQSITVVWVQNVLEFANPDTARLLVATAWWQVSVPLMTGIIGAIVQSFFCLRFYILCRNWILCTPIICAIFLGLTGVCLSLAHILSGNADAKVIWLLVHLVGVFIADVLITAGTCYSLRKRSSELESTSLLINRLLRLVFESAFPPAVLATADLVMTQTLGPHLLWHLFVNMALGKVYVVSLLYTLNSLNEYLAREQTRDDGLGSRRANVEFAARRHTAKTDIFVQTQVSTHISPSTFSPEDERNQDQSDDYHHGKNSKGFEGAALSDGQYAQ
ncbi:hypothetical protein C8R43DRAFT_182113 [Mycena crocata]|nr:hypothetical protein C8R43DRAFT_182113 [Mycena crocata]